MHGGGCYVAFIFVGSLAEWRLERVLFVKNWFIYKEFDGFEEPLPVVVRLLGHWFDCFLLFECLGLNGVVVWFLGVS